MKNERTHNPASQPLTGRNRRIEPKTESAVSCVELANVNAARFESTAREVLRLLDLQVAAIVGRRFDELTPDEVQAYQARKQTIFELRSELSAFTGSPRQSSSLRLV